MLGSLLFWLLVPLGSVVADLLGGAGGDLVAADRLPRLLPVAALPVRLAYQKYFDPFALLALRCWPARRTSACPPTTSRALFCAGSVAYALSFVG